MTLQDVGNWLAEEMPDGVNGWALLLIAAISAIWGVFMMRSAFRIERVTLRSYRFWFYFLLGAFLVYYVAGMSALFSWLVFSNEGGVPRWWFIYSGVGMIIALLAFVAWARAEGEK